MDPHRLRRPAIAAALGAAALAAAPAPANAGQIVWARTNPDGASALWAANDDGSFPHQLLAAASAPLLGQLLAATLASPDLFQLGGATVLFSASTNAFGALAAPGCGAPCAVTFSLTAGVLARQSPAALPPGAVFERQPRVLSGSRMVSSYAVHADATAASPGAASQQGLYVRPLSSAPAASPGTPWADTATETLAANADPAPDPVNPRLLAWVENQDPSCRRYRRYGAAVCQYAILVGPGATAQAPAVAIFDDESPGGAGPSSLAWSSDGSRLLVVDDQPPNNGIYSFAATTAKAPAAKTVTEVIAEPPGWTFGQARFAGRRIVFDASGGGHSTPGASDVYSISASCDSGTCAFPPNATNLTRSAAADNSAPAWTSASAPLLALGASVPAPGSPPVLDAAAIRARSVTAKQGVAFEVTLSGAGSLQITVSRGGRTIGTTTLRLPAGASTFKIARLGGRPLSPGSYEARLRVKGAPAGAAGYSARFTVR